MHFILTEFSYYSLTENNTEIINPICILCKYMIYNLLIQNLDFLVCENGFITLVKKVNILPFTPKDVRMRCCCTKSKSKGFVKTLIPWVTP